MSKPLEQRVAAALTTDTKSDTVTALIAEVEAAAQAADADATKTREQALDPAVTVDTAKVGAAVAAAELTRDRLRAALPRLRERYKEARLQEDAAKWNAEAEKLKARRIELVTEFAQMLPVALIKKIAAQLIAMREFDKTISAHNYRRPDDDSCRSVPCATPAFAQELRIPDMEKPPGYFLWPPPYDPTPMLNMIRPDPFVGAYVADGTYARVDDERRRAAEERRLEEARQREREFVASTGGR